MNRSSFFQSRLIAVIGVLFLMLAVPNVMGQKIKDLKFKTVKTPNFKDSEEPTREYWARFVVEFSTVADWTREMDVRWTIVSKDATKGGKAALVMQETVTYEDIEKSGRHWAAVYLKPSFSRHYQGRKLAEQSAFSIYVELVQRGKTVDAMEKNMLGLPNGWYKNAGTSSQVIKGQLLPKSKTPFAIMDYDAYEHEKLN